MPRISRARDISSTRICGSRSHTSGRSMAGFSTEPRSPPVQVATRTRAPSATYRAMVAAPLLDSSSGWACTASRRSWSGSFTAPLSTGTDPAGARPATRRPGDAAATSPLRVNDEVMSGAVPQTGARRHLPVLASSDRPPVALENRGSRSEHLEFSVSTTTDQQDQGVWLTQEAHDRLRAELDQLIANRPAM